MNSSSSSTFNDMLMTLDSITLLFLIIGVIWFITMIIYVIRVWLVQTATFQMQRDLADIRDHLLGDQYSEANQRPSTVAELKNFVSEEERAERRAKLISDLKPRRAFVWVAISIPVLLIVLFVLSRIY